jgi:hypothetical protein
MFLSSIIGKPIEQAVMGGCRSNYPTAADRIEPAPYSRLLPGSWN